MKGRLMLKVIDWDIVDKIKYDERGLVPAIVQDAYSGEVLTLAYMNEESLKITLDEGRTCFFSRSRNELWRKGESSGNIQYVRGIYADCDSDALLIKVDKTGPACHTGADSCFFNEITEKADDSRGSMENLPHGFSVDGLYDMLVGRKDSPKEGSYTSYLFESGIDKILKKVGEECTEVIISAKDGDTANTIYEVADLYYHVLVMLIEMGIKPEQIESELAGRHIIEKKEKQKKMR